MEVQEDKREEREKENAPKTVEDGRETGIYLGSDNNCQESGS